MLVATMSTIMREVIPMIIQNTTMLCIWKYSRLLSETPMLNPVQPATIRAPATL